MGAPCLEPRPLYRPRNPRASGLWRIVEAHFEAFAAVYDERYQERYGFWRPVIRKSIEAFLKCGDLREGFARVRCPNCRREQAETDLPEAEEQGSSTWAMLLRRVFEMEPLACPSCGAEMQVVSFIQPPQEEVIEAILRHCGLWEEPAARAPPKTTGSEPADEAPLQRVYVDLDTFLAEY